jgi:hypothetical protein
MEIIVPMATGAGTVGPVPGNLLALTLQNVPVGTTSTLTSTATSTTTLPGQVITTTVSGQTITTTASGQTITTTASGQKASTVTSTATSTTTAAGTGVDITTLYGVAAVAVIFIIATGYLAMRGRKPGS